MMVPRDGLRASSRLLVLAVLAAAAPACREAADGVNGPDGEVDWGPACEPALCARECGGSEDIPPSGLRGVCIDDRCVCRCDDGTCSLSCHRYEEREGDCRSETECVCVGCYFGNCHCDWDRSCPPGYTCRTYPFGSCDDPRRDAYCVETSGPLCPGERDPVCGCDEVSYWDRCTAEAAGVLLDHAGRCGESGCAGPSHRTCPEGTVCRPTDCSEDAFGVCLRLPDACPTEGVAPACGCDGSWYPSDCERTRAGVAEAADGCGPPPTDGVP